ncbi:MAG TPA: hypothetical protein VHX42_00830, partial [Candidatus Babeliales bacterium]|nr:hypothetical protein [Candidatus Babeliales bacterium]
MLQLMQNRWNFSWGFCLVASFYGAFNIAMETPPIVEVQDYKSEKILIFNSKKEANASRAWNKVIPRSLLITPDKKG